MYYNKNKFTHNIDRVKISGKVYCITYAKETKKCRQTIFQTLCDVILNSTQLIILLLITYGNLMSKCYKYCCHFNIAPAFIGIHTFV